jgi:hypothetical protein
MAARRAVEELGPPLFGLAEAAAGEGGIGGYGGAPCDQVTLRYETSAGPIEVTTARRPLGGTSNLVRQLLARSVPSKPRLPWTVTLDERLVMLPVLDIRTQFRVMHSSTGHWMAAGGFKKRHLLLAGHPGTAVDRLVLGRVSLEGR